MSILSPRQAIIAGLVVLTVTGTAALAGGPGAGADEAADRQYTVVARADAFAVEYFNSAAPGSQDGKIIYGTPSTAQSLIDALGRSEAFASAPYPGDLIAGGPSNANGLLAGSGAPGLPAYPFFVASAYPATPSGHHEQGAYRVDAESSQHRSAADARTGLAAGDFIDALTARASSESALDTATGTLKATADGRIDGFKVTDVLKLGQSTAHAEIVRTPGQAIAKSSSFTIAGITIAGTQIGLNDKGFTLGEATVQAPTTNLSTLFGILKQAGITLEYLPATGTDSSIESAGVRISHEVGQQRVTIVLGRVSAAIQGSASPAPDGLLPGINTVDPNSPSFPAPEGETTVPDTTLSDPGGASPATEFLPTTGDAWADTPLTDTPVGTAGNDTPPATSADSVPAEVQLASPAGIHRQPDAGTFYLSLVAAALISLALSQLSSGLGVKRK